MQTTLIRDGRIDAVEVRLLRPLAAPPSDVV